MGNELSKIETQLLRLKEQRKALLQRKKKEEENELKEVGKMVAKLSGGVERVDVDLLKNILEKDYLPMLLKDKEGLKDKGALEDEEGTREERGSGE